MSVELKVPEIGESITEVTIGQWLIKVGDWIDVDGSVVEIESDKVNADLPAPVAGRLTQILKQPGEEAKIGEVIGMMEAEEGGAAAEAEAAPAARPKAEATPEPTDDGPTVMPAAARLLAEHGLEASAVSGTGPGGRVLKEDVQRYVEAREGRQSGGGAAPAAPTPAPASGGAREEELVPMTSLRKRIAERLVSAQQTAAILTTFNEVDMSAVIALRKRYQERFKAKHEIKLGFMSFFVKAAIEALKGCPELNASIEGESIRYRNYYDIGVAVGSGRGLVVPVIRNAERLSFAEVEKTIVDFAVRARNKKLKLDELQGGTFTITNGGVYGSMLSTPIINPPQSGILGMHNIVERPVAIDGEVVIRPIMYLALSYDHRIVDGREAVGCLVRIKEAIEDPTRILIEV